MKKEFTGFVYERNNLIRYREFLDNRQLFFLRMYAHNCSMEDIYEFIEIDAKQTRALKKTILQKFNSKNLVEATHNAFNLGTLNIYDYAHPIVKKEASLYAQQIMNYFSHGRFDSVIHNKIFELNLSYYRACRKAILSMSSNNGEASFSEQDQHLAQSVYIGENLKDIVKSSSLDQHQVLSRFHKLKSKLRAQNHFNFLRKAMFYNLIKHDNITDAKINELCLKSMLNISKMYNKQNIKISQQNIMRELVEFYCDIEFRILFAYVDSYTLEPED